VTTPLDLDALLRLHGEATQGGWEYDEHEGMFRAADEFIGGTYDCFGDVAMSDADAELAAAAVNALPALGGRVRASDEEAARLRAIIDKQEAQLAAVETAHKDEHDTLRAVAHALGFCYCADHACEPADRETLVRAANQLVSMKGQVIDERNATRAVVEAALRLSAYEDFEEEVDELHPNHNEARRALHAALRALDAAGGEG
jgi:hypothetical protein